MTISSNTSIQSFHSFGFELSTKYLIEIESLGDLHSLFTDPSTNEMLSNPDGWMVMGEGSNMLFARDFLGSLLVMRIAGITLLKEDEEYVFIEAGAGEDWHSFVRYTLTQGWFGLENLSLIPGSVGAAPVQNIGAYGVEVEKYIIAVRVYDVIDRVEKTISHFECMFGYRDSIFKHQGRSRFIITHVWFRLEKLPNPVFDYTPIKDRFDQAGIRAPHPLEISDAVMEIRRSKLPNPARIGNAGSFFKNPLISTLSFERLKSIHPGVPGYQMDDGVKVPAGWLIEQCGWKGYREGSVGCFDKQALVLVHYGGGTPGDLLDLARRIRQSVFDRFAIRLEAEVNIIGDVL
jgi:UDP-N-acetylmuramate dehydrogenase